MSDETIGQGDIDALMRQAQQAPPAAGAAAGGEPSTEENVAQDQNQIDALMQQAQQDDGPGEMADQNDIDAMMQQAAQAKAAPAKAAPQASAPPAQAPAAAAPPAPASANPPRMLSDAEVLLQQAEEALASVDQPSDTSAVDVAPFSLQEFMGTPASTESATIDLVRDVELDLRIELGRTHMHLEEVLQLRQGSVVALNKLAGDPVDVYVNGRLIARGEVLVLNDNFCVRVAELLESDAVARE